MYKKKCDGPKCDQEVWVYAKSKEGNLPLAFHSKACEANYKYEKRFDIRFKNS